MIIHCSACAIRFTDGAKFGVGESTEGGGLLLTVSSYVVNYREMEGSVPNILHRGYRHVKYRGKSPSI